MKAEENAVVTHREEDLRIGRFFTDKHYLQEDRINILALQELPSFHGEKSMPLCAQCFKNSFCKHSP